MSALCAAVVDPDDLRLDLDQLYAAYAASHRSVEWAELVLDQFAEHREELIDGIRDDDEQARRVIAWLRRLPEPS